MPRGARVAERAPAYEAPPRSTAPQDRTDAQWRVWLDKMKDAGDVLYRREEVVEMANRARLGTPSPRAAVGARTEISAYLAEAYARFPEEPEAEEPDEVRIVGEEKSGLEIDHGCPRGPCHTLALCAIVWTTIQRLAASVGGKGR